MILDIIFFALILIFSIFGVLKGFSKTLVSFLSGLICLLLAYLLAKVIANALLSENMAHLLLKENSLFDKIYGLMPDGLKEIKMDPIRDAVAENGDINSILEQISSQTQGFFALFASVIRAAVVKDIYLASSIDNVAQVFALELTYHLYVIIIGILFYVLLRVIVMGVTILGMRGRSGSNVGLVQRLAGLALGAVRGLAYACIMVVIASYISGFSAKVRDQIDSSAVSRPVATWVSDTTGRMLSNDLETNEHYLYMIKALEERSVQETV